MFPFGRASRPRCKYCSKPLRNASKKKVRWEAVLLAVGLAIAFAFIPKVRPGSFVLGVIALMLVWPRKQKWVCEHCGVAYRKDALRGPAADQTRVDDVRAGN